MDYSNSSSAEMPHISDQTIDELLMQLKQTESVPETLGWNYLVHSVRSQQQTNRH